MTTRLNCILLIDDDEDDNFFHQAVIKRMNIANDFLVAESGTEALDLILTKRIVPDLIFLDLNMPKMNGWEFLERYNESTVVQNNQVIIIILTTSVNRDEKERSTKIPGISGFRSKPVTEEMMQDIIAAHF